MNALALFASPTPDSSDRFKTLKTDSILPCIWPSLNPLTNYRLAEQVSVQRGAIPIQILPYSLVLSHISLSSAFFWPFSSSPLSVQPIPLSPFLTLSHSYTKNITILSRMCFFSLSFYKCPCSVCFLLSPLCQCPCAPPPLCHISLSSMSALLTLSLRHYPHLFTSLIASILYLHFPLPSSFSLTPSFYSSAFLKQSVTVMLLKRTQCVSLNQTDELGAE